MLEELISEEKRKLHELEHKIADFSCGRSRQSLDDILFESDQTRRRIDSLDQQVAKAPRAKIEDSRRRLLGLKSTLSQVESELRTVCQKQGHLEASRNSLFGGRHVNKEDVAAELAENGSLNRSSQMIGEYLAMGKESLNELVSQRERLKSLQKRVLDIFNYLGLSNTLMKGIENRDAVDKWIVLAGMVVVVVVIVLVYYFMKK